MVVALNLRQAAPLDDGSWRMAGCGGRCQSLFVKFPGRRYSERVVTHDPDHHEAHGRETLLLEQPELVGPVVRTGRLEFDRQRGIVLVDGGSVQLTPIEFRILSVLAGRLDCLCPHDAILQAVWGAEFVPLLYTSRLRVNPEAHLLRVNMARLRKKLGPTARGLLQTVPARGYRLLDVPPLDLGGSDA